MFGGCGAISPSFGMVFLHRPPEPHLQGCLVLLKVIPKRTNRPGISTTDRGFPRTRYRGRGSGYSSSRARFYSGFSSRPPRGRAYRSGKRGLERWEGALGDVCMGLRGGRSPNPAFSGVDIMERGGLGTLIASGLGRGKSHKARRSFHSLE